MILIMALAIGMHAQAAPLPTPPPACPEHQHDVGFHWVHNCSPVAGSEYVVQCDPDPPQCVDDMHEVTEKEWLEIQTRLKDLEATTMRLPAGADVLGGGSDLQPVAKPATCSLFDENNHPTEQVPCDDPRIKWPTSATISLYKSDGTCISGACAVQFPPNPKEGDCWMDKTTQYCFKRGSWQFKPQDTGMHACGSTEHLHPRTMSQFQPDVKGGPLPKADGLCHRDDNSDAPVLPHGKKLEARK